MIHSTAIEQTTMLYLELLFQLNQYYTKHHFIKFRWCLCLKIIENTFS